MNQVFVWLSSYVGALGIVGAGIAFIWSVLQFVIQRRRESEGRQFDAYPKLAWEVASLDTERIPRQAAVVFELRHFPRYYEYSQRLLSELKRNGRQTRNCDNRRF